jgi:hypothetical protein
LYIRTFYVYREGGLRIAASTQSFPKTTEGLERALGRFDLYADALTEKLGEPTSDVVEDYIASFVRRLRRWTTLNIMVGESNSVFIGRGKFYAVVLHEYMRQS